MNESVVKTSKRANKPIHVCIYECGVLTYSTSAAVQAIARLLVVLALGVTAQWMIAAAAAAATVHPLPSLVSDASGATAAAAISLDKTNTQIYTNKAQTDNLKSDLT